MRTPIMILIFVLIDLADKLSPTFYVPLDFPVVPLFIFSAVFFIEDFMDFSKAHLPIFYASFFRKQTGKK